MLKIEQVEKAHRSALKTYVMMSLVNSSHTLRLDVSTRNPKMLIAADFHTAGRVPEAERSTVHSTGCTWRWSWKSIGRGQCWQFVEAWPIRVGLIRPRPRGKERLKQSTHNASQGHSNASPRPEMP